MFRSGQHKTAIQYLLANRNDKIRRFGELYQIYYEKYGQSLPTSEVDSFYNKCKLATEDFEDMYKDAIICLMMGSEYQPKEFNVFWNGLLMGELETQLWFKLKLSAYKLSEDQSEM